MNCNVISYFSCENLGIFIDVSLRRRLLFSGESPGSFINVLYWVAPVVQIEEGACPCESGNDSPGNLFDLSCWVTYAVSLV